MNWLIVEDQPMMLDALKNNLEAEFEGVHIYKALNGFEALEILKENRIDFVITDLSMPEMDGLKLIEILRRERKEIRVMIYTSYIKPLYVVQAQNFEVEAYVVKSKSLRELVKIIESVLSGTPYFDVKALKQLEVKGQAIKSLSPRQLEIAQLLSEGYTGKQIAEKLNVTLGTVKSHRINIYSALEVKTVIGLVNFFNSNDVEN